MSAPNVELTRPPRLHLGPAFRLAARRRILPDCCTAPAAPRPLFDLVYLINVDHATSRERFSLMAAQLNASCLPWRLWPGVVPTNASFVISGHLLPRNIRIDRKRFDAVLEDGRSRGMLGNYLSHMTLWEHLLAEAAAAKKDEETAWLVLEDDVWLAPGWADILHQGVAHVRAAPV